MHTLFHYRLCPLSRSIRLALAELAIGFELREVEPWAPDREFLTLNPAADLPVLKITRGPTLCGAYSISEFMAEELKRHPVDGLSVPLFPGSRHQRADVRRLVDWSHGKLNREVTQELLHEKVYTVVPANARSSPNSQALRAAGDNLHYSLAYFSYLLEGRKWLGGEDMSFADLAAAAHLSVIDYLDDVPWGAYPNATDWYARLKSRKSFRPLLADRISGLTPPAHYADLDF